MAHLSQQLCVNVLKAMAEPTRCALALLGAMESST